MQNKKICTNQIDVKSKAFSLLAKKAYFSHELIQKLKAKGYSQTEIFETVKALTTQGLLNDEELSLRLYEHYKKRGYGPKMIAQKLFAKTGKLPLLSLEESYDELLALIERRYKKHLPFKRQNVIATLLRRGFSLSAVIQALNSFK